MISTEYPPGPGGIGTHAHGLSNYLSNNGFLVTVATISDYTTSKQNIHFDNRSNHQIIRFNRYKVSILTYFSRLLTVFNLLNNNYLKIICTGKFSILIGYIISKVNSRHNLIAIAHGSEINPENKLQKWFIHKSFHSFDSIISVSHFTESILPKNGTQSRLVIHNALSDKVVGHYKKSKTLINNKLQLLTIGSITKRKGQKNMIKALPSLIKEYPSLHYNCIGDPIQEHCFTKYAKSLGVEKYITFHGILSDTELINFYNNTDILVMLSTTQRDGDVEGFGIAVLEANYFGIPVLGSNQGGILESINNGYNGILVNAIDSYEIFLGIKQIVKEKDTFKNNCQIWANKFCWNEIGKKYLKLI